MRVLLDGSGVNIDEKPLGDRMSASDVISIVGPAVSNSEIPMHPSGVRQANVSASGIVWYVDYPEDRISHLHLALSPSDTPEHPASPFTGQIRFDGTDLTAEVSEAAFARNRGVLVRGYLHTWSYETVAHHVSFVFKRRRNRLGKRSGPYRLAFVSIDFRSNSEPDGAAHGSQPIR